MAKGVDESRLNGAESGRGASGSAGGGEAVSAVREGAAELTVSQAPHISKPISTRRVMIDVLIGLIPAVFAAGLYFRFYALILIGTCVVSCVLAEWLYGLVQGIVTRKTPTQTEWIWKKLIRKELTLKERIQVLLGNKLTWADLVDEELVKKGLVPEERMEEAIPILRSTVGDLSAVVTGVILALSLPPAFPWWGAVIGSVFAIVIGKLVFGGLGSNIFNPAMVGRAFLTASFGALMATWTVPATIDPNMSKIERGNVIVSREEEIAGRTQATPLWWSKLAIERRLGAEIYDDQQFKFTLTGETGGCLGETSAIAILIGGVYLLIRRTISWHIPAAVLLSALVFGAICYRVDSYTYVHPFFHLASGGLLLGAFFIATDPVTAPMTRRGMWLFGAGVGTLTMLIRIVGALPEGVMYSVLLMNAVTPLIDRLCRRKPYGGKRSAG